MLSVHSFACKSFAVEWAQLVNFIFEVIHKFTSPKQGFCENVNALKCPIRLFTTICTLKFTAESGL